jgi:hypothetical protein
MVSILLLVALSLALIGLVKAGSAGLRFPELRPIALPSVGAVLALPIWIRLAARSHRARVATQHLAQRASAAVLAAADALTTPVIGEGSIGLNAPLSEARSANRASLLTSQIDRSGTSGSIKTGTAQTEVGAGHRPRLRFGR